MIKLNEFEKLKIEGFALTSHGDYEDAIEVFNTALNIETDPQIFNQMAMCYCYLRDYKTAQEYCLKAIQLGYDAYQLYTKITVGNLRKVYDAMKVLLKGVELGYSSACLEIASLHINNNDEPDMENEFKAAEFLEKAIALSKPEQMASVIESVLSRYKILYSMRPYLNDPLYFKENRVIKYYHLLLKYKKISNLEKYSLISVFDDLDKEDDHSIIQYLFDNYNGDSLFILGLFSLEDEYKTTEKITASHESIAFLNFSEGALRFRHGGCSMMMSFCYSEGIDGAEKNEQLRMNLLKNAKIDKVIVPERFEYLIELYANEAQSIKKAQA